jgi:hypothetical protein
MSLLAETVAVLGRAKIAHALIGGLALAARGVLRGTLDVDLLADARTLDDALWAPLRAAGAEVSVRRGDSDDPLAGVVRIRRTGERPVDVVVPRRAWELQTLERAEPVDVEGVRVPCVTLTDLVLLKLSAGGNRDRWDIGELLAVHGATLVDAVDARAHVLDERAQTLWRELR